MTTAVVFKLLAVMLAVAVGWVTGRTGWLTRGMSGGDPARLLGNIALYIFVPALLFRTAARLDLQSVSLGFVGAYFVPAACGLLIAHVWAHASGLSRRHGPAAPATRAMGVSFGNSVQLGVPLAAALFGEAGLALHLMLISLHALMLLTLATVLVEWDLARQPVGAHEAGRLAALPGLLLRVVRDTLLHPVVLPIVLGLACNLAGVPLHPVLDELLLSLGAAVVPVCLVLIGLSLAQYGVKGQGRGVVLVSLLKLLVFPAGVLLGAHWVFGLVGLPLAIVVMMAALPTGSNALLFAQRYDTLKSEASGAIVMSTLLFVFTAPLWLFLATWVGGRG